MPKEDMPKGTITLCPKCWPDPQPLYVDPDAELDEDGNAKTTFCRVHGNMQVKGLFKEKGSKHEMYVSHVKN